MKKPPFTLQQEQTRLSPKQEAEAQRFAQERVEAHLSTKPANEREAEHLLRQAYRAAKLAEPTHILWFDGPLQLVARFVTPAQDLSLWPSVFDSVGDVVVDSIQDRVRKELMSRVNASLQDSLWASVGASLATTIRDNVGVPVQAATEASVWARLQSSELSARPVVKEIVKQSVSASVCAYFATPSLALAHFYNRYLAPNEAQALAHLNELVSGYWFGEKTALLVRRPKMLARDAEGRLHSAKGKCLQYRDGWGFYVWHGVRVPEKVILMPHLLTSEDWQNEESTEARRVIQERMGSRFVRG